MTITYNWQFPTLDCYQQEAGEPYTSFSKLTEPQVEDWTKDALGAETVDAMYANIAVQIENQINHKSVTLPPPWAAA